ncbi:hypothetical protein ACNQ17_03110 [Mycoplasma sp. Sp48II]|uniref:hypothetical protein n=1 Tax=unclassified Mycoplasma TaxID=2683645 RepID=UPI003A85B926
MNDLLFYASNKCKGDSFSIFTEVKNFKHISRKQLLEWKQLYDDFGAQYYTILDEKYPSDFNVLRYPPYVLYFKGNEKLLNYKHRFYLINEINNPTTQAYLEENINTLAHNCVLITNDYESERHLINLYRENNGKIIHILKEGLDKVDYHEANLNNELFLTQYPLGVHPKRHYFKEANIIASIISTQLIAFSLTADSKAFNLINYFNDIGKEINCFPSSQPNDGNDVLIKSGANYITKITECV